jgi:hypothetical protein
MDRLFAFDAGRPGVGTIRIMLLRFFLGLLVILDDGRLVLVGGYVAGEIDRMDSPAREEGELVERYFDRVCRTQRRAGRAAAQTLSNTLSISGHATPGRFC